MTRDTNHPVAHLVRNLRERGESLNFRDAMHVLRALDVPREDLLQAIGRDDVVEWFRELRSRAPAPPIPPPAPVFRPPPWSFNQGPRSFRDLTDEQIAPKVHEKLRELMARFTGGNVAVIGPTGCGKSLASFALLRKVARQTLDKKVPGRPAPEGLWGRMFPRLVESFEWFSAFDLCTSVLRHPLGEGAPELVTSAKSSKLIVIDDLQTAPKDDTTIEVLWSRYDAGLPTIATCGLPKAQFLERFGDAFGRRLIESNGGRGTFVDCF